MTDYKQLCAEGVAFIWFATDHDDLSIKAHEWAEKANAALAEPEPEGPTDEELRKLWCYGMDTRIRWDSFEFARAVLARWGNHPESPDSSMQPS